MFISVFGVTTPKTETRKSEYHARRSRKETVQAIDGLSFITDKRRWGIPFRRGLFEISQADFALIAAAMAVAIEEGGEYAKD